jgi:hypothetical protein
MKVTALDAGNFSKVGFDIRETQDAGAKAFNCVIQRNADGTAYLNSRNRTSTGGSRSGAASALLPGVVNWLRVTRAADGTWSCASSVDGNTFTAGLTAFSLPMLPEVFVNAAATSTQAGTARSSAIDDLNVTTAARLSYTYTTASSASFTVRANAGSSSSYGAAVTGAPSAGASTAIRFRPGHYLWPDGIPVLSNAAVRKAQILSVIGSEVCPNSQVKGIQMHVAWAILEGTSAGDYSAGFAFVDEVVDRLNACGKLLMLVVHDRWFGGSGSDKTIFVPAYLFGATYGAVQSPTPCVGTTQSGYRVGGVILSSASACNFTGGLAVMPAIWEAPVMDRLIALAQAYGARYNGNASVEMFSPTEEIAVAVPPSLGYSHAALGTQIGRLYAATREAWPNTALRLKMNYYGSTSQHCSLMTTLAGLDVAIGGPDTLPAEEITTNELFTNRTGLCADLRGIVPFVSEVQTPQLGGKEGTYTAAQLYTYAMDGGAASGSGATGEGLLSLPVRPQYWVWIQNEWSGGAAQRWSTGLKPYVIATIDGAVSNGTDSTRRAPSTIPCPSGYPSCTP